MKNLYFIINTLFVTACFCTGKSILLGMNGILNKNVTFLSAQSSRHNTDQYLNAANNPSIANRLEPNIDIPKPKKHVNGFKRKRDTLKLKFSKACINDADGFWLNYN